MNQTNIHTIVVHTIQILAIVAIALENAYPGPALAFADTLNPQDIRFTALHAADELHDPTTIRPGAFFKFTASAYTSIEALTDASPTITASGAVTHYGTVASNILPLGTMLTIGDKTFTVQDRMSRRYDHKMWLDIWMPTLEEAQTFGVRTVYATIQSLPNN